MIKKKLATIIAAATIATMSSTTAFATGLNTEVAKSSSNSKEISMAKEFLTSIKDNNNGTITITYKNSNAKSVYFAGNITEWQNKKIEMTKSKDGIWNATINVGNNPKQIVYKLIVNGNWITDPGNSSTDGTGVYKNSVYNYPGIQKTNTKPQTTNEKEVVLAGTMQTLAGSKTNWNPASQNTKFTYVGNGIYKYTINNLPEGTYQYKVAIGGSWKDNYGAYGKENGSNMSITNPKEQDVTFWYSDVSHITRCSLNYTPLNIDLNGTGLNGTQQLNGNSLNGIYTLTVNLPKGIYNDISINVQGKTLKAEPFTIKDSSEKVTFTYNQNTNLFSNSLEKVTSINKNDIYFNSRESEYKSNFGAIKQGEKTTFNIKTPTEGVNYVNLVMVSPTGQQKTYPMKANGNFGNGFSKWSTSISINNIGIYHYYFTIGNNTQSYIYSVGQENGVPTGVGQITNNPQMKYELTVYEDNYKTPNWMKHAVFYEIFVDSFRYAPNPNEKKLVDSSEADVNTQHLWFEPNWYKTPINPSIKDQPGYVNAPANHRIWNTQIYGGNLKGIQEELGYLKALGVNALYLTPIYQANSNHRYDGSNYGKVDSIIGNNKEFEQFCKVAHKMGFHIMLDGAFENSGENSIYFDRWGNFLPKKGDYPIKTGDYGSPIGAYQYWKTVYNYMDNNHMSEAQAKEATKTYFEKNYDSNNFEFASWFKVYNEKNSDGSYKYDCWWGYTSLPAIRGMNGQQYKVKSWANYIYKNKNSIAEKWIGMGSNGWRLDSAPNISQQTWQQFRKYVKGYSPNSVILGEIWTDATQYFLGNEFDSVMNYRFRGAVIDFLKDGWTGSQTNNLLQYIHEETPNPAYYDLLNLTSSQDTARILSVLNGQTKAVKLATPASKQAIALDKLVPYIQMTYPGAPSVYYGDEIGMIGAADPNNRAGFKWGKGNENITTDYAKLMNMRDKYDVLQTGGISPIKTNDNNVLAYERFNSSNEAVAVINKGNAASLTLTLKHMENGTLYNALTGDKYKVVNGKVIVNMGDVSGLVLVKNYKPLDINMKGLQPAFNPKYIIKENTDSKDTKPNDTTSNNPKSTTNSPEKTNTKDKTQTTEKLGEVTAKENSDGTVSFTYFNNSAKSVTLETSLTGFKNGLEMKKDNNGLWTVTINGPKTSENIEYKFVVNDTDWTTGSGVTTIKDGYNTNDIIAYKAIETSNTIPDKTKSDQSKTQTSNKNTTPKTQKTNNPIVTKEDITLRVTNEKTGALLKDTNVIINGESKTTNDNGEVIIQINKGNVDLKISAHDYYSTTMNIKVEENNNSVVNVSLNRESEFKIIENWIVNKEHWIANKFEHFIHSL